MHKFGKYRGLFFWVDHSYSSIGLIAVIFIPLYSRVIAKCPLKHYAVQSIAGGVPGTDASLKTQWISTGGLGGD